MDALQYDKLYTVYTNYDSQNRFYASISNYSSYQNSVLLTAPADTITDNKLQAMIDNSIESSLKLLNANKGVRYKIYVHPNCKTPRDVIRKTYDIVRSEAKADIILMYTQDLTLYTRVAHECFILADVMNVTDGKTHKRLYEINTRSYDEKKFFNDNVQKITKEIERSTSSKYKITAFTNITSDKSVDGVFVSPKHAVECMLINPNPSKMYIPEDKLPLDTPTKLTLETLNILWRCTDRTIFAKTITSSDWRLYPLTCYYFLVAKRDRVGGVLFSNAALRSMFNILSRQIGSQMMVQPEDIKLYQDFFFMINDIDTSKSSVISVNKWNSIAKQFPCHSIKHGIVLQKYNIVEPKLLRDIQKW